jgi:site-specific DNA-methyltransferase (adenine-specific)
MKKVELFNDHFQNFKVYGIPHAQLIIADPPYNLGKKAYASKAQAVGLIWITT